MHRNTPATKKCAVCWGLSMTKIKATQPHWVNYLTEVKDWTLISL
jgi:hypothetical protein